VERSLLGSRGQPEYLESRASCTSGPMRADASRLAVENSGGRQAAVGRGRFATQPELGCTSRTHAGRLLATRNVMEVVMHLATRKIATFHTQPRFPSDPEQHTLQSTSPSSPPPDCLDVHRRWIMVLSKAHDGQGQQNLRRTDPGICLQLPVRSNAHVASQCPPFRAHSPYTPRLLRPLHENHTHRRQRQPTGRRSLPTGDEVSHTPAGEMRRGAWHARTLFLAHGTGCTTA
jgi:hypothetical protein